MLESATSFTKQDGDFRTRESIEFNRFLEYMPAAIAMFDQQMQYVVASQRWQEYFGGVVATGTCFSENCPGNLALWQDVPQNCQVGAVATWEEAVTDVDGMLQWVKWEVQPWYDEVGNVGGSIVSAEMITDLKNVQELQHNSLKELEDIKLVIDPASIVTIHNEISHRQHIEEQLQVSQQFLQLVLDNIPQLIFWKDRNSEYLGCNHNFATVAGLEKSEDIVGKTDYELPWTTEESDWYRDFDRRVMESGTPRLHIIETQQQADGRVAWLDTCKIPLPDRDGNVIGILGTIEDITIHKQAEEILQRSNEELEIRVQQRTRTLRTVVTQLEQEIRDRQCTETALAESEARFRQFVENVDDLIYSIAEDGSFTYLSPQFSKMFGYEVDEWQGKSFVPLVHAQDLPKVIASNQQIFETGERQSGLEFRVQHRNKSWVWMVCNNSPIQDTEGRVIGFHGIGRDITDRKAVEAALAESEAKFRHLVEGANDLIYAISLDAVFTYVAPQVPEILGYHPSEIIGKSIVPLTHPDDVPACIAFNQSIVETGEPRAGIEIRAKRKNESWCWITCNNSPIKDPNGNIVGIQGMARDISDRKASEFKLKQQAEELDHAFQELKRTQSQMLQSEKMSSLGQMVAGVAHEINNPVNFIHGNLPHAQNYVQDLLKLIELYREYYPIPSDEIQEEIASIELDFMIEDLNKMFQSMRVGTRRIREIVISLRNFSRLDESDFKEANIHEGIDNTLMLLQNRLKAKPDYPAIKIIKNYGNLPLVECYPGQLNQVFMNIFANAIDALEDRVKTHSWEEIHQDPSQISIETELVNSKTARIRIKDNGVGIPETIQTRIFDPFFTTKKVGKGTGLGMSISYQIITERHQGAISCISSPGKGTELIIEIPRWQSQS